MMTKNIIDPKIILIPKPTKHLYPKYYRKSAI